MAVGSYVFVFAAFCVSLSLQSTPYLRCSSGLAPIEIRYEGCKKFPCKFKKNTITTKNEIVTDLDFVTVTNAKDLIMKLEAKTTGPYRTLVTRADMCSATNKKCPIEAGEIVNLRYKFSIPFFTKKSDGFIRVKIYNEKYELQTCFQMMASVV